MANTRLITKSVVISLAICCVLAVAMLPTASANYGDVRRFLRPAPPIYQQSPVWDIYWWAVDPETPPGRVCSIFTLGAIWGMNFGMNTLTSEDGIIIGVFGYSIWEVDGFDEKSAKDFYRNWETHLYINGAEVESEVTPYRKCRFVDETGFVWIWWEWRVGATFKKGELPVGVYEFRQTWSEYGTVIFDTDLVAPPYYFQIV